MPWREQLRKWREIVRSRVQAALSRLRRTETTPAAAGERVSQLGLGELLSAQQAVRQDLNNALNEALTLDALPASDARYLNRSGPMEQLQGTLDAWRAGQPRMIACYGPHGSGVSTLLNQIAHMAGSDITVHHHTQRQHLNGVEDVLDLCGELFDLTQPPSSTEQALTLVRQAARRLVVIDNAHNFSLRIAGNAPVMRTLGMLMVASRNRHLWVLGCNEEAWSRLVHVHDAKRYFTDQIPLTLFNGEELVDMLAQRFALADVHIGADNDEADTTNSDTSLPGELLMRLSNGHPRLAIALLIKALTSSEDPKRFVLSLPQKLNMETLDALLPQDLFALAEIAVHGALTAAEHRAIFRRPIIDSQMLLADLYNRQLLCRQPSKQTDEETYCLHPVLAPLVTAFLHRKNLLY